MINKVGRRVILPVVQTEIMKGPSHIENNNEKEDGRGTGIYVGKCCDARN
jgi:hypothetical protein